MKNLILTIAALALTAGMAYASDTVRLGTEGAYAPWNFLNDAGEVDGFEREVGDELCKRAIARLAAECWRMWRSRARSKHAAMNGVLCFLGLHGLEHRVRLRRCHCLA